MQKLNYITLSLQCVNISEVMLAKCPSVSLYSAASLVTDGLGEVCLMRANKKKNPVDVKHVRFQRLLAHYVKCNDTLVQIFTFAWLPWSLCSHLNTEWPLTSFQREKRRVINLSLPSPHKFSFWDWDFPPLLFLRQDRSGYNPEDQTCMQRKLIGLRELLTIPQKIKHLDSLHQNVWELSTL